MNKIKFVSYDGKYPILCSGKLVLKINKKEFIFPKYSLSSGGCINFDEGWNAYVFCGEWRVDEWPIDFQDELKEQALEVTNENVPCGCCGGCI